MTVFNCSCLPRVRNSCLLIPASKRIFVSRVRNFCLLIPAFNCSCLPRVRNSCLLIPASKCIFVPRDRNFCLLISASNCNCITLPSVRTFCLLITAFNCSCLPMFRITVDPCFQLYLFTTGPNLLSADAFFQLQFLPSIRTFCLLITVFNSGCLP